MFTFPYYNHFGWLFPLLPNSYFYCWQQWSSEVLVKNINTYAYTIFAYIFSRKFSTFFVAWSFWTLRRRFCSVVGHLMNGSLVAGLEYLINFVYLRADRIDALISFSSQGAFSLMIDHKVKRPWRDTHTVHFMLLHQRNSNRQIIFEKMMTPELCVDWKVSVESGSISGWKLKI